MQQEIIHVDAFTDKPFSGNPAAVCVMNAPADPAWMQNVAREMNLAETAFVWPLDGPKLSLRWFSPTIEVDLCGHATLASAHVLWETGNLKSDATAYFQTRSGELRARRDGVWIEMDFPALPAQSVAPPPGLIEAISPAARDHFVACGRSRFDYLVELDLDQSELVALVPDLRTIATIDARAVIVTTRRTTDPRFNFVSRFFCCALESTKTP